MLAEIMCDICNMPMDLDETCYFQFPRNVSAGCEAHLAHSTCVRDHPNRFPGWSQIVSPRSILQTITEQDRHPQIVQLLRDLKGQREDPIT